MRYNNIKEEVTVTLEDSLLSILSCQRFLTVHELSSLSQQEDYPCQRELMQLENQNLIYKRYFAGRYYFRIRKISILTDFGKKANTYLDHRPQALKLCQARTCYDHLAGKIGINLFQILLDMDLVEAKSTDIYYLTEQGQKTLSKLLSYSINQQQQLKTCIDFSERIPHLSGELGRLFLATLLKKKFLKTTDNRRIIELKLIKSFFAKII